VDTVRATFVHSPCKSTKHAAPQLNKPHTTVQEILQKLLKFKRYKYQLLQHVTAKDKEVCYIFALTFFQDLKITELFTAKNVFSDEATFLLSGNVNQHNLRIWGSNNPHKVIEHMRDSPKLNVSCSLPNVL
jgi:hypothetical protein